jgi:class 3 adenylate cyclase
VKVAAESQVVVDDAVVDYCRTHGAPIHFSNLGERRLRGIEEPVVLSVAEVATSG